MAKIGVEGLLEGELINNLVTELRLVIKRPSFKKKADARKQESKHNFTYSKRYHTHLCKNSPYLYGIRLTLCYWGEEANPASLEKSDNHIQTFLEPLKTSELPNSPVGWWYKREHTTEAGYAYNLIIFFDRQKTPFNPTLIPNIYGPYWRSVTEGQGTYFIPPVPKRDCMRLSTGLLQQGIDDNVESLLLTMQCLLKRDNILKLEPSQGYSHIGMGKIPKSPKRVKAKFSPSFVAPNSLPWY